MGKFRAFVRSTGQADPRKVWPLAPKRLRLEEIVGPTPIDVVTTVVSPNEVTSPLSGLEAAFVQVEVLERVPPSYSRDADRPNNDAYVLLGSVIFGDLVKLELEGGVAGVELLSRRAELRVVSERAAVMPMERAIPELVALLSRAKRGGVLCQREHLILSGERLRLRAVVERVSRVVASGDRSDVVQQLVVRDDLAPVVLDEVLDRPF